MTLNTQAETLTEAYHVIYDIKDRHTADMVGGIRYLAYETLGKMAELMMALDLPVPVRFDGDGRQAKT